MAAPTTPIAPGFSRSFWQNLVDGITLASNLSIPLSTDVAQAGVISGATASLVVAALQKQRDLM